MFNQYIINDYLRAFIVFVIFFLSIRILLFFTRKVVIKLTTKTKTDLDDKLVAKLIWPLTILSFLISLFVTLGEFILEDNLSFIFSKLIYSVTVLVIAYIIYIIVDLIVISTLKRFARKTKSQVDDALISLFHSVLDVALILIALVYILNLWGIEVGPLLAGLGIAGLAIALALQPVLSNIFSGASMILDRSIRVGDLVYLDSQTKGKIEKIGIRSTRIKTFDNELIITPNNKLAESTIQNVALPEPKSRVVISFSVAYGTEIEKVKKVIGAEIKKIKKLVDDPKPTVRFLEMADSALNFKAYFYVESYEDRFDAIDEANTRIYNALNKADINIPFPQLDVHVKK